MERIDQFNDEEVAFKMDQSQYPDRKIIHDKLRPYKSLYDNATDFLQKSDLWLNSMIGSFEPEEIDTEVSQFFRVIYKLEKQFADRPATKDLAGTVRERIEDFKDYMPIIQTLGNPGLKPRHWAKISEIVGFPIVVDESLTLNKILDYCLEEFLAELEAISEAATKENNLEKTLNKMYTEWADQEFQVLIYKFVILIEISKELILI